MGLQKGEILTLVDGDGREWGRVILETASSRNGVTSCFGRLSEAALPAMALDAMRELEELIDVQLLSEIGDVLARIAAFEVAAMDDEGRRHPVRDLQIFPKSGACWFALVSAGREADSSKA
jgi:hypothetical protein